MKLCLSGVSLGNKVVGHWVGIEKGHQKLVIAQRFLGRSIAHQMRDKKN